MPEWAVPNGEREKMPVLKRGGQRMPAGAVREGRPVIIGTHNQRGQKGPAAYKRKEWEVPSGKEEMPKLKPVPKASQKPAKKGGQAGLGWFGGHFGSSQKPRARS